MTSLAVAAIQLKNRAGNKKESLAVAEHYLILARKEGAQLAVLPELSCCGYIPNQDIWQFAEDREGPSVRWAADLAEKLGMHIGAGFLEFDGANYYNSYFIANPRGGIDGIVRKTNVESYCFRSFSGENVISTALGRIGVGICADNHSLKFLKRMHAASPDIMLLPHGWPMPSGVAGLVSQEDFDLARSNAQYLTSLYAEVLNVPALFVNAVGDLPRMQGILGKLMSPESFCLGGCTQIADSGGRIIGVLDSEEGIMLGQVTLGLPRKEMEEPVSYGDWLHKGSGLMRKIIFPLDAALGRRSYKRNINKAR